MTPTPSTEPERSPDASDVVEGPVGDSSIKDPSTSGPIGADLEALTPIDAPPSERTADKGETGPSRA
jgi:hypothetical protein